MLGTKRRASTRLHPAPRQPAARRDGLRNSHRQPHACAAARRAARQMDVLSLYCEAYVAKGDHPLEDAVGIDGLRRIGLNLKRAVQNGKDLEAREQMLLA